VQYLSNVWYTVPHYSCCFCMLKQYCLLQTLFFVCPVFVLHVWNWQYWFKIIAIYLYMILVKAINFYK
jgi:hypothetical protein